MIKAQILQNVCYTELVYKRINKKLGTQLSRKEIEALMLDIIKDTAEENFIRKGKNYYISNFEYRICLTINSNTF